MAPIPFSMLYLLCLGVCLGGLERARQGVPTPPPEIAAQLVERMAVAVPPRPEGVRPIQGAGGDRITEAQCKDRTGQFREVCFHHLARQRAPTDLNGAIATCEHIGPARPQQECMADVAELHAPTDTAASLAVCPTIPRKKWRDQCVFGIALAVTAADPKGAFRLCDQAGMWRDFCRHDVNGEIAVVDLDMALAHCAAEEGGLLMRKSCWHGIGKYIARVDAFRARDACAEVPAGLYRENCVHGMGWGAAEKGGIAFAGQCGMTGLYADSCRLGVAYNHRRFDQRAALDICEDVMRSDLRAQCREFVDHGILRGSPD